jgi:hypothetical protein
MAAMAFTNAEKQQRWRDKRNAEAAELRKKLERAERDTARLRRLVQQFLPEHSNAVVNKMWGEGHKAAALATLERAVAAIRAGKVT